ncbi:hypothetical protein GOM49_15080 [Clostridium bovifaecis]|uniref:Lipoprotein n=1 Tax=Clostridium bovifaecis TaxID=2184719 RepID=A0A6I6EVD9_9CLOT|nr:hypothetical protein GOM49_15080 [Clostridium bovifaecis]
MKKIKGYIGALLIGATLFSATGCGKKDGLVEAIQKTNTAKSFGYKGKIDVKVDGQLPPEAAGFNNLSLEMNGKYAGEQNKNAKVQANVKFTIMGLSADLDLMEEMSLEGEKANIKMLLEIPELLKAQTGPMFQNYDYLYVDTKDVEKLEKDIQGEEQKPSNVDTKAMMDKGTNIQKSLLSFMKEYKDEDGKGMVEDTGKQAITVNGAEENLQTYKVSVDNDKIKKILKAYLKDEKRAKEIQDYINTIEPQDPSKKEELNIEELAKEIDTMPNVLGKDGLVLDFAVKDGYVVQYKIKGNFAGEQGISVNINLAFDLFDINKEMGIKIPNKTDVKAIDLTELMNMFNGQVQ